MRVLMLSKACLVGIYQRKLEYIARHPAISALQVVVPPFWREGGRLTPLERAYIQGYELKVSPMRWNGNFHLHYYPHFPRLAQAFRPDLIHIDEEPYNLATWLAWRVARKLKAKSLFFSWQNLQRRYPWPFAAWERDLLRGVDYALVGNQEAVGVWRGKGYQKGLALVPQFGVDTDLFQPRPRTDGKPRLGFIGRLVPEKGADIFLNALARLADLSWEAVLIGDGVEGATLWRQAEALGLEGRVRFMGQLPSLEMPAHMRELDILAVPSRTLPNWKEQFGRVIIEAMASGVVVVGAKSGAIPEVLGEAGLLFAEGSSAELAVCLRRLLTDSPLRENLRAAGLARARTHYTHAHIAAQTVAAYQAALAS
jgi:glycosyltransferase involved in cell wall biosynthesis